MIAGGVMLLSFVLGGAVDADNPAPEPTPPATVRSHRDAELAQPPAVAREPSVLQRWYGWQLLLTDLASLTLGFEGKTGVPAVGATIGFTLAAPALHFAHGNRIRAGVSLLVRASVLGIAAAYGASWNADKSSSCHDDSCKQTLDDVLPGVLAVLGGAAFVVIDDTALSLTDPPATPASQSDPSSTARRAGSRFAFAPTLAPTSGGVSMGLLGIF